MDTALLNTGVTVAGTVALLFLGAWETARRNRHAEARKDFLVDRWPGLRMRDVARSLGAAGPSVTRLCDRLEAAGFLRRHPCPDDGREITLRLTPAGHRHLAHIREKREQMLGQALDAMPADGRHALATGLAALQRGIGVTAGFPQQDNRGRPAA
ncbi:MarR family winged helix-turn-helix transcriptional regulator [Streptomyces sp. NPDC002602]|uniref:MarR family winged helix-turn-helix transcriptional regulator n=1 Tax=Streptomyces sp. NPDC002602 TaxID=3364654 RepID=UPI0036926F6C